MNVSMTIHERSLCDVRVEQMSNINVLTLRQYTRPHACITHFTYSDMRMFLHTQWIIQCSAKSFNEAVETT